MSYRTRLITLVLVSAALLAAGGVYTASGEDKPESAQRHEADVNGAAPAVKFSAPSPTTESCLVDPMAIEDLKRKADDLAKRSQDLDAREKELRAKESALQDEVSKLKELRDEIAQLDETKRKLDAGKVGKVVETVQGMSPRAAAKMMGELDDALAVSAAEQMDSMKLGKILAAMDSSKSARITELMAGVVRAKKHASNGAAATTDKGKGGEIQ